MVMRAGSRVELHQTFFQHLRFEQALLGEQVERVVDRRPRQRRAASADLLPGLLCRGVRLRGENVLRDRQALRGRPNAVSAQELDQSIHGVRLGL